MWVMEWVKVLNWAQDPWQVGKSQREIEQGKGRKEVGVSAGEKQTWTERREHDPSDHPPALGSWASHALSEPLFPPL